MAYRVGEVPLKTCRRLLLDLLRDLGVAGGVANTLSVLVLHVDDWDLKRDLKFRCLVL